MRRINTGLAALASLFVGLAASLRETGGVVRSFGDSIIGQRRRAKNRRKQKRRASYVTQHTTYTDRIGQPHGNSGDKLRRKALQGKVGVGRRGPYDAWAFRSAALRAR